MLPADWKTEDRLTMEEAAAYIGCSRSSAYAYCATGARAWHGGKVVLESFQAGGRQYTSRQAVDRWVAALSRTPDDALGRTPDQAREAGRRAKEELLELLKK